MARLSTEQITDAFIYITYVQALCFQNAYGKRYIGPSCTYDGEKGAYETYCAEYSDESVHLIVLDGGEEGVLALNAAALDVLEPALLVVGADQRRSAARGRVEAQGAQR